MTIMRQIKLPMRSTTTLDNEITSIANTRNKTCSMISNREEQITYGAAGVEPLAPLSPISLMERLLTSGKKSSLGK